MSKLDPKEAPPGCIAKQAAFGEPICQRCCLIHTPRCYTAKCAANARKDKAPRIYFVQKPEPKKPTKPRRKAHVVWVGSYTDAHIRWMPFVAKTRADARRDRSFLLQYKHQVRGPVKVVLP